VRRDIDYRRYDPANFKRDHPDDPVLADSRAQAEALAARFEHADPNATPLEQRREIEQTFDHLHDQQWDRNQAKGLDELKEQKTDYTNEKTDAIYEKAFDRMEQGRFPNDKWAGWQGVQKDVADARQSAPNDPEYQQQREQLEQYQAARSEAASHEITDVQQQLLKERGLDQVDPAGPEPLPPKIEEPAAAPANKDIQERKPAPQPVQEPAPAPGNMQELQPTSDKVQDRHPTPETAHAGPPLSSEQQSAMAAWERARTPEPPLPSSPDTPAPASEHHRYREIEM